MFLTKILKLLFCTLLGQVLSSGGIANTTFGERNIYSWNYVKNSWVYKILMKNKQCKIHRCSQGEPRGPCAPNFSISSYFVLWEAASETKVLLFTSSQTFALPKFWVGYTTGRTSNDRDDNKKPLVWNFDSVAKTSLQPTHLIQVLTPHSVQLYIYHINSINCDSSIVIDILVGLASLEHLYPERNDYCLRE